MASYLSKPREFTPYTPEVNADLYGKLLMKKEAEYQAGVEKVNKSLDYVSTLPVVGETKRAYLQSKVNQMTTALNKDINTNWSDQAVQQLTTGMINSIANDPTVQGAVGDALNIQKHYKKLNQDSEENGAAAQANRTYFEEKYLNPYLNSTDLNQRFKGEYTEYQDADTWADDIIGKMKPEWKKFDVVAQDKYKTDQNGKLILDKSGKPIMEMPAYKQWSKQTNTWEQIPPNEIRTVLELAIRNNPSIDKQLQINAYSATKSFTEDQYAQLMKNQRAMAIAYNNDYIDHLTSQLNGISNGTLPSSLSGKTVEEQKYTIGQDIEKLKKENQVYLNWKEDNDKLVFRNPEMNERIRNEYFKESFIQEKMHIFGRKTKESITYEGDPETKILARMHYNEQVRMNINQVNHEKIVDAREDARDIESKRRWYVEHPDQAPGAQLFSERPTSSIDLKDTDTKFHELGQNAKRQYNSSVYSFIFDNFGKAGEELVTKDENGIIKVKADATGSTVANEKKIAEIMSKFYSNAKYGKTVDLDNKTIQITDNIRAKLQKLMQSKNLSDVYTKTYDEMEKDRKLAGKDRLDQLTKNLFDNFDNIAKANGIAANHQDLTNLLKAINDGAVTDKEGKSDNTFLNELLTPVNIKPAGREGTGLVTTYDQVAIANFDKKHGAGSWNKYYKMYNTKAVHDIIVPSDDIIKEQKDFNNTWLKAKSIVPVGLRKTLTVGKSDEDLQFKNKIKGFTEISSRLNQRNDENKSLSKLFTKKSTDAGDLIQAWIDPVDNKKYLIFKESSNPEIAVEIKDPNANYLFATIPTEYNSALKQTILNNPRKSTYTEGQPNWDESYEVGKETHGPDKGKIIRTGLTYDSDSKLFIKHTFIGNNRNDAKLIKSTPLSDNLNVITKEIDDQMANNNTVQIQK